MSYGHPLPKLITNKPSAYTRYGNVMFLSLEVKLVWDGDRLTPASTFGSCKFDTASPSKIAPKNLLEYIDSLKTSGLRWESAKDINQRLLSKAPNILSSQIDGLFQPSAQNFVLLLADKKQTLRDLKGIGFDLNEQKQRYEHSLPPTFICKQFTNIHTVFTLSTSSTSATLSKRTLSAQPAH